MNLENDIEKSIRDLRRTTTPQTDERILADAMAALRESTQSQAEAGAGRMKRRIVNLAGVALIVCAILIGVGILTGPERKPGREITEPREVSGPGPVVETVRQAKPRPQVKPPPKQLIRKPKDDMEDIERMLADGDTEGLVSVLVEEEFERKLVAAAYLAEIGDLGTVEELEQLAAQFRGDQTGVMLTVVALQIRSRLGLPEPGPPLSEAGSEGGPESTARRDDESDKEYIHGWLVDTNGNVLQGVVEIAGSKSVTSENRTFTVRRPTYTEFMSSFGRAFAIERNLGCFFILDRNKDANDIIIVLEPPASVSGLVVDRNANPVGDFEIRISPFVKDDLVYKSSIGDEPWVTQINADGSFEVGLIPLGVPLQLAVKSPGFSTPIRLEGLIAGQNLDLGQIILEPLEGFDEGTAWDCLLAGLLVDENNEPVIGAKLSASTAEERYEVTTDAIGRYEFKALPQGVQMTMVAYADGYGYNSFHYTCFDPNSQFDVQIFPPAYDWYDRPAPGLFVEQWFNTEPIALDELKGQVVLLYIGVDLSRADRFIQQINQVLEEYAEELLTVIGIAERPAGRPIDEEQITRFIEENNIEFPFALDAEAEVVTDMMPPSERLSTENRIAVDRRPLRSEGAMYSLYELKANPGYYLIDKNGVLRASATVDDLDNLLRELVNE